MKSLIFVSIALSLMLVSSGCGEITYPKETLTDSVKKLCKEEYNLDVDVSLAGTTLAIYLPLPNLFNVTLSLSEKAQDKVQDVLLGASRIVLSTDADIKFYCIIAQDIRLPEIQLVIIKYTNDVKRAFYRDISRGEYFKRTLIDINENPQAKKEQAIIDVFGKMGLDKRMKENVLDDFFRAPPSSLEGIGYWSGKFYIKNITLEEFLAEQMASRIRTRFREKEALKEYGLKLVTGTYEGSVNPKFFLIDFKAESLLFVVDPGQRKFIEKEIFTNVFEEISDVIYAYKFQDFNLIEMIEKNSNEKLLVPKEDVYLFKKRKLGIDAILGAVN
ncbi:MAG: hypothetical protein HQ549_03515 [Candidatus Omnitrophica bacterium]|nr:hypothetical protein [Candidatus Omnitrophota bacterium]